jgi:hypothetical protein
MKYRTLRIALSAVCGVLCLLLIALWVASYGDTPKSFHAYTIQISWSNGILGLFTPYYDYELEDVVTYSMPPRKSYTIDYPVDVLGHKLFWSQWRLWIIRVPFWTPVTISVILAAFPWLRWRFSLRTLLIATTLVAVALGIIIALSR